MEFHPHSSNEHNLAESTTLWTTAFGTIGGICKAQALPTVFLETLSINGSLSVISYAFMSAVVGYCTKKALDFIAAKMNRDDK